MQSFVFHRDDLVPGDIDTDEKIKAYDQQEHEEKYGRGDLVRNRNKLEILMHVHELVRKENKLIGIKCYWWED